MIHEWKVKPIVTLVSEFWEENTQWHNGNEETFVGDFFNVLKVQVEFKYKKPYGGSARFRVYIDRLFGSEWENVITDETGFYPNPGDDNWHSDFKEYEVAAFPFLIFRNHDYNVSFRIRTQIETHGSLPTSPGGGSLGSWSEPEQRTFKAVIQTPKLVIVKKYVSRLITDLEDQFNYYHKKHV